MSMYNLIHGQNAAADWLLALLNLTRADVGRFRDAWVNDGEAGLEIAVYTRNGGGNREHWNDERKSGPGCGCTGCTIEHDLPAHPLYLRDVDDDFDSTYATVFFRVPEAVVPLVNGLVEKRDPDAEWLKALDDLKAGLRPDVEKALAPLMTRIASALSEPSR